MKKYYRNSEKYIKSLNNYSKDADIEFRVFDIFKRSTTKYNDWSNISDVFYIIRKCKYLKQIDSIFFNSIDPLTYDHLEIFIHNRWGKQIFYSNQKDFKWDGTENGRNTSLHPYF